MTEFNYIALTISGARQSGVLAAATVFELESRLHAQGLELLTARRQSHSNGIRARRVSRQDLITFCFNLEQMSKAGVPLLDGLLDLRHTLAAGPLRQIVGEIIQSIEGGKNFSAALQAFPHIFNPVFINLVEAGERSGELTQTLAELTNMQKWEDELIAQTRKLLLYPLFSALMVGSALVFLLVWLVPQLAHFIQDLGGKLPLATQILLAISHCLTEYWLACLVLPPLLLALVIGIVRQHPGLLFRWHGVLLCLPLFGSGLKKLVLARFAATFARMFRAGVPILEALQICQGVTTNRVLLLHFAQVTHLLQSGTSLTESFLRTGIFPPLVIRMLKIGETSGELDTALRNVTYFYEREVQDAIEQLQTLLAPCITIILGLFLLLILSSLLGPVFDLISQIR